jgi:hypothetical protein
MGEERNGWKKTEQLIKIFHLMQVEILRPKTLMKISGPI